jgi:ribosomal protein S20
MPITKSGKKSLRQAQSRRIKNVRSKVALKKTVKNYSKLLKEDKEKAAKFLPQVYKSLDKAAKAKLIKANKANRTKSRLASKLK